MKEKFSLLLQKFKSQAQTQEKKQKAILGIALILLFIVVIIAYILFSGTEKGQGEKISFHIEEGMSSTEIADNLKEHDIINSSFGFKVLARLRGYDTEVKEGIYYLRPHMSINAVLNNLIRGPEESVVRITIPEGFTVEDIAALLDKNDLADKEEFCELAKSYTPYDYMKEAIQNKDIKYAVEGFLFPDTYDFDRGFTAKQIMQIMLDNFDRRVTTQMREKAEKENLSVFKLIVMASLVEKEARYEEDRPIIADVFFKRIEEGMPLQSDATIQYVLDEHKEEFSIEDTKLDSPYNTYQHAGLTPGPIGNPGLASINAVLNPSHTDYLYFVADKEGHNHYSVTYDEHLQEIREIYGE